MPVEIFADAAAVATPEEEEAFKALEQQNKARNFIGPLPDRQIEALTMDQYRLRLNMAGSISRSTPNPFIK